MRRTYLLGNGLALGFNPVQMLKKRAHSAGMPPSRLRTRLVKFVKL